MITSELLEAYLACPTKCYLRSIGEASPGTTYAAWYQARNDLYRREGIRKLIASTTLDVVKGQIDMRRLKTTQWQFAFDQIVRSDDLEARLHGVQRTTKNRELLTSEFSPIRFIRTKQAASRRQDRGWVRGIGSF